MNTVPFVGLINSAVSRKENFEGSVDAASQAWSIIKMIIGLALGIFAGYVSWQSNSSLVEGGFDTFLRVVYAFFAFLFGLVYLVIKAIINPDAREIIKGTFQSAWDRVRGRSTESAYPETMSY